MYQRKWSKTALLEYNYIGIGQSKKSATFPQYIHKFTRSCKGVKIRSNIDASNFRTPCINANEEFKFESLEWRKAHEFVKIELSPFKKDSITFNNIENLEEIHLNNVISTKEQVQQKIRHAQEIMQRKRL